MYTLLVANSVRSYHEDAWSEGSGKFFFCFRGLTSSHLRSLVMHMQDFIQKSIVIQKMEINLVGLQNISK